MNGLMEATEYGRRLKSLIREAASTLTGRKKVDGFDGARLRVRSHTPNERNEYPTTELRWLRPTVGIDDDVLTVWTGEGEEVVLGAFRKAGEAIEAGGSGGGIADATVLLDRSNHTGQQAASTIYDLTAAVEGSPAVMANTNARHIHGNQAVLDAVTAAYTTAMETKLAGIQAGAEVNVSPDWNATSGDAAILNKPPHFPPAPHTHDDRYYTEIETDTLLSGKANTGHTHTTAQVTGLDTALASKANVTHTHPVGDITAAGTPSASTYLSGAGTWTTPANTTYAVPTQAEAEAGTATTGRAFSAQRVNQAIQALAPVKPADLAAKADVGHDHDSRYYTEAEIDAKLAGLPVEGHTHTAAQITDFWAAVSDHASVSANTQARHTHTNKTVLDAITAAYTTSEKTKLSGIAAGATANATDAQLRDRATHTGTQSADTITDGTTNKAYTAAEKTKLAGIVAGAEVNVNADWNAASGDAAILNKPSAFPPASHSHPVTEIAASGTRDGTTFLAGDGAWKPLEEATLPPALVEDVGLAKLRAVDVEGFFAAAASRADAWQAAIDSALAAGGMKVVTRTPEHILTKGINTRGVAIEGPGSGHARLEFTETATPVNGAMLYAGGSLTALGGVTANIPRHATSFTLLSSPGSTVAAGDWLIIYDNRDGSFSPHRPYYRAGEYVQVHSVSGATVTLASATYAAYTAGAHLSIHKLNPVRPQITGLSITFRPGAHGITFDCAADPYLADLVLTGANYSHIQLLRSVNVHIAGVTAFDMQPAVGTNYGISIANSQNIDIDGCFLATTRHGLTTGGTDHIGAIPVRNITVRGGTISSTGNVLNAMGCDMHGNIEYAAFLDVTLPRGVHFAGNHTTIRGRVRSAPGGCAVKSRELTGWDHDIDVTVEITEDSTVSNQGWIDIQEGMVNNVPFAMETDGRLRVTAVIDNQRGYKNPNGATIGCYIYNRGMSAAVDVDIDLSITTGLPDLAANDALGLWLRADNGVGFRDVDLRFRANRMGAIVRCSPRTLRRHDCYVLEAPFIGLQTAPITSPVYADTTLISENNIVHRAGTTGIQDLLGGTSAGRIKSVNDEALDCNRKGSGTTTTGGSVYLGSAAVIQRYHATVGDRQAAPTQVRADAVANTGLFVDVAPLVLGTVTTTTRSGITKVRQIDLSA